MTKIKNIPEKAYCSMCGSELTSDRSKRLGIGQRCKWKRDGRPTRKRTTTQGQGMPIDDVPFMVTGKRDYVQMRIDDF